MSMPHESWETYGHFGLKALVRHNVTVFRQDCRVKTRPPALPGFGKQGSIRYGCEKTGRRDQGSFCSATRVGAHNGANGVSATAMSDVSSIKFTLPGIAELIASSELKVPIYQRSYSWNVAGDEQQLVEYWADLEAAFGGKSEYFLGTVVLAFEEGERRTIIDGQQRLATTSLLLAAIRDQLQSLSSVKASVVETNYIAQETLTSVGKNRRLMLNLEDDDYFSEIVVGQQISEPDPKLPSQKRLKDAFEYLRERVAEVAVSDGEGRLIEWVSFLHDRARIGVIGGSKRIGCLRDL